MYIVKTVLETLGSHCSRAVLNACGIQELPKEFSIVAYKQFAEHGNVFPPKVGQAFERA